MDFTQKYNILYPGRVPMPIYLPYPDQKERRDMEYLQRIYSEEVRQYQKKIAEVLDRLDYEGSMIYDEYPDIYSVRSLADTVIRILKHGMEATHRGDTASQVDETFRPDDTSGTDHTFREMILILVCDEIYKRRHGI